MTGKPQNSPPDSDQQHVAQMLERGTVNGVLAFVENLRAENKITPEFAEWIFAEAKQWHLHGWIREQWVLYELVKEHIADNWLILHALGYRAQVMGENGKARDYYEEALKIKPDYVYSQLALGQMRMLDSAFRNGREFYEARFAARDDEEEMVWKEMLAPRWRGENLKGKTLYLWAEQGLGDIIMFAGFLPHILKQAPQKIVLGLPPRLISLFARSFPEISVEPIDKVAGQHLSPLLKEAFPLLLKQLGNAPLPLEMELMKRDYERAMQHENYDYASPMGDLLFQLMPEFAPVNNEKPYLAPDSERVKSIKRDLAKLGPGRKIGISWHTTNIKDGMIRNIPLEQWAPILNMPNCNFISLQHGVSREEIASFCAASGNNIHVAPASDIEGLAALIAAMDEMITIDNSNAHLAGALGVPTTLMLPKGCNFRWALLDKSGDNLWYKSVKLERQEAFGNWQPVIKHVAANLRSRAASA